MAGNEVEIVITSQNTANKGIRDASGSVKALGVEGKAAAEKIELANEKIRRLEQRSRDAAIAAKELARQHSEAVKKAKELGDESEETARKIQKLAQRSRTAADRAGNLDNDLGRARHGLTQMSLQPLVQDAGKTGAKAGMLLTERMGEAISAGLRSLPPEAQAAGLAFGAVFGAAASSAIGAALAGAVIGGAAVAAVAGGIKLASSDPKVQSAAAHLGDTVMDGLNKAAKPFIAPTIAAIGQMEAGFNRMLPRLEQGFQAAAGYVAPLANGVENMVTNLTDGFVTMVERAGPVVDVLNTGLSMLGSSGREALEDISEHADEAAAGLEAMFLVASSAIEAIGSTVAFLAQSFGWFAEKSAQMTGSLEDLVGWIPILGDEVRGANDMFEHLDARAKGEEFGYLAGRIGEGANSMGGFKFETEDAADLVNKLMNSMLGLDNATLGFNESLLQVKDSFDENGKSLDMHTEKGIRNRKSVQESVQENLRVYNSMIAAGSSAEEAAAKYDQNTQALERQLQKAGLTKQQIDDLIGKYRGVPGEVNTDLALHGVAQVLKDLNDTLRAINGLPAVKNVTVRVGIAGLSALSVLTQNSFGARQYASGGIVGAAVGGVHGGLRRVNEMGPEMARMPRGDLVSLPTGSTVIPAGASQAMTPGSAGGGSGARGNVSRVVFGSDGGRLGDALIALIRETMLNQGGNPALLGIAA